MKFNSKAERDKFILDNQNLVYKIINTYYKNHVGDEDFKQAGFECLIRAVDNFEDKNQIRFSSYACECIRLGLLRYIYEPRNQRYLTLGTRNAKNKNRYEHYPCLSLDYEYRVGYRGNPDEKEKINFEEIIENLAAQKTRFLESSKDFTNNIETKIVIEKTLNKIIFNSNNKRFTEKIKKIIYLWLYKDMGVIQISRTLGLTKQSVSYIIKTYKEKIRKYLETQLSEEEINYLTKSA